MTPNDEMDVSEPGGVWLSAKDAAERLGKSVDTVKRYAQAGKVRSRRDPGGHVEVWLPLEEAVGAGAPGSGVAAGWRRAQDGVTMGQAMAMDAYIAEIKQLAIYQGRWLQLQETYADLLSRLHLTEDERRRRPA